MEEPGSSNLSDTPEDWKSSRNASDAPIDWQSSECGSSNSSDVPADWQILEFGSCNTSDAPVNKPECGSSNPPGVQSNNHSLELGSCNTSDIPIDKQLTVSVSKYAKAQVGKLLPELSVTSDASVDKQLPNSMSSKPSGVQSKTSANSGSIDPLDSPVKEQSSDSGASVGSSDWQSTTRLLHKSFAYIFENKKFCDVELVVGIDPNHTQKIGAHKLVLATRSSVFCTMLSKEWSSRSVIEIPGIDPKPFTLMLQYMYSDSVSLSSENITSVIYAAQRFAIPGLEDECIKFLLNELFPENACNTLSLGVLFNYERLIKASLDIIAKHTYESLNTPGFFNIDEKTLCLILKRTDLSIPETSLFEAALRWAEAACEKIALPANPENQRLVLGGALSLLRFPAMKPSHFMSKVFGSGVLTEKETISVLSHFVDKSRPCVFSSTVRKTRFKMSRFCGKQSGGLYSDSTSHHRLLFTSNLDVQLMGIGLYGSPERPRNYDVHVTLRGPEESQTNFHHCGSYENQSKELFDVLFHEPFRLKANTSYFLDVIIQGEYFVQGYCSKEVSFLTTEDGRDVIVQFFRSESYNHPLYQCRCNLLKSFQHFMPSSEVTLKASESGQIPELYFEL